MQKLDLKQQLKPLYQPAIGVAVKVDLPPLNYLMIDGSGDPNHAQSYQEAVEALFALAYTLKFMVKKSELAIDYGVMPLEGLWWADDMTTFSVEDKSNWQWTLLIMQPDFITPAMVADATVSLRKKKDLPALKLVRLASLHEGTCAQIMHIGPFSEEPPNIEKVHNLIEQSGCTRFGKHHEIYLSDIRKADSQKWKTVIRQPMR